MTPRLTFAILLPILSFSSNAQTMCNTAGEGGTVTLTAPAGNYFTGIDFASYGTPNGSCNNFTLGGCHAANSVTIVEGVFVGNTTGSVNATNGVFGDPCGGTVKRLYVQARYSLILPLTLVSLTAQQSGTDKVKLDWVAGDEINTLKFEIESGTDGNIFAAVGSVAAAGSGRNKYSFVHEDLNGGPVYYYRLKMLDVDGKYRFSNLLRVNTKQQQVMLRVFPSPADDVITVSSGRKQIATISSLSGRAIRTISLIAGNQTLHIAGWPAGVYIIKTDEGVVKFVKR